MDEFIPITTSSRTGPYGRDIICPHCNQVTTVGHFAWVTMQCIKCLQDVPKVEYKMRTTTAKLRNH